MGSLGMFFYIVECFPVNLENLAANAVRSAQLCRIDQHIKGDSGFVAVPLGKSTHQVNQISALHPERTQVCDGLTQLRALVLDGLLEAGKAAAGLVSRSRIARHLHDGTLQTLLRTAI